MKVGALLGLVALIVVFHAPGLCTGFLSDDFMILGFLHQQGWTGDWTGSFLGLRGVLFYRPLLTGSYALDHAVWGLNPWGYHATNLLLSLLVVGVVFQLGRRLTGRWSAGFMAAALVGLNPLNPNTVTWIAGRVSLLGTLFPLAAFLAFLAWRQRPRRVWLVTAVGFTAAGLASKESAAVVPLFLLVADGLLPRPRARKAIHVWLWVLLVVYLVVRGEILGTLVGGYGGADPAVTTDAWRAMGELLGSMAQALVPFWGTQLTGIPLVDSGLALVAGALLAAWIVVWCGRGAPGWRPVVVALLWSGSMVALFYPAWELDLANAERWYPALVGGSLALAVLLARAGRRGAIPVVCVVILGLPALWQNECDYQETGARVRTLVAEVQAVPAGRPVVVYGLPLTRSGAPFLHFGLADALAPPFQESRVEVYPVHAPLTTLAGRMNPLAYVMATKGEVTVLQCNEDGRVQAQVDRTFLLGYEMFRDFRDRPAPIRLDWSSGFSRSGRYRARLWAASPRPLERVVVFLATPAGGLNMTGTLSTEGQWSRFLGPAAADYLLYPGCSRAYVVAFTLDKQGQVTGLNGMWIAR